MTEGAIISRNSWICVSSFDTYVSVSATGAFFPFFNGFPPYFGPKNNRTHFCIRHIWEALLCHLIPEYNPAFPVKVFKAFCSNILFIINSEYPFDILPAGTLNREALFL